MSAPRKEQRTVLLLRRADQVALGTLTFAGFVALAGYWFVQGGHRGQLIDVDRAEPRNIQYQVDLNSADWPELTQLPDIGETLAKRIVASRAAEGPFIDHNDLERVKGIGPRTLDRIKPYLRPMPPSGNVAER